jgi:hypothetical protein
MRALIFNIAKSRAEAEIKTKQFFQLCTLNGICKNKKHTLYVVF